MTGLRESCETSMQDSLTSKSALMFKLSYVVLCSSVKPLITTEINPANHKELIP